MIDLTLREIQEVTSGKLLSKAPDTLIGGLCTDSRTIAPGQVFVAIKGANFDGHDFVAEAAAKGAQALILERDTIPELSRKVDHIIIVDDALSAMSKIAAEIRQRVFIPVVGVTGTNGKTTVKEILAHLLSSRYKTLASRKSYNNIIGLSLTLFELDGSYDAAVLEMGTNHPGEIRRLAEIARPDIGIITNIGNGHLESFGDRRGVFSEKTSLLDVLPSDGAAFLNKDDDLLTGAACRVERKFFGISEGSDFLISGISAFAGGSDFFLNGKKFSVPLEGVHNVYNASAAIAAAWHLGVSDLEIGENLRAISPPAMHLERVSVGGFAFINDSYNANPNSFDSALQVLQDSPSTGKKVVVAGSMKELGRSSGMFHRMLGRSIAERKLDLLITLGDEARSIIEGALESGMSGDRVHCAKNHEDAASIIKNIAGPDPLILLKGSRAARMEEVLRCFTISCTR